MSFHRCPPSRRWRASPIVLVPLGSWWFTWGCGPEPSPTLGDTSDTDDAPSELVSFHLDEPFQQKTADAPGGLPSSDVRGLALSPDGG